MEVVEAANGSRRAPGGGGLRSAPNLAADRWWVQAELPRRAWRASAPRCSTTRSPRWRAGAVPPGGHGPRHRLRAPPRGASTPRFRAVARRAHRAAARGADAVVCVSEATARDARARWGLRRATGSWWRPTAPGRSPSTAPIGARPPTSSTSGDAEPRKNLPALLAAYRVYRERAAEPLPLVLAGTAEARAPGVRVELRPDAERLAALYAGAAALAHPALHEGFGLTLLEAMSTGTPVVAGRVPGVVEVCARGRALRGSPRSGGLAERAGRAGGRRGPAPRPLRAGAPAGRRVLLAALGTGAPGGLYARRGPMKIGLSRHPVSVAAAAGLVAAFGLGALTTVEPMLATAVVVAPIVGCAIWAYPKASALAVALVVLFSQTANAFLPGSKLLDDVSVAAFVAVIGVRQLVLGRAHPAPGAMWFLLYVLAGVASSSRHGVPASLVAQDAYLFLKGVLFGMCVAQLDWNRSDVRRIARGGVVVLVVIFTAGLLNAVTGQLWFDRFALSGATNTRSGLPSLVGPFNHPGIFGQVMALAAAAFASHAAAYGTNRRNIVGLLASVLGVASALRRKAAVGVIAAVGFVFMSVRRWRFSFGMGLVLVVPLVALIFAETVTTIVKTTYGDYVSATDPAARTALYQKSVVIAGANFPLGAGLGRFGGEIAISHYSPVYFKYRLSGIYGLTPDGRFATDTFWPAVLGEAGVLGLIGYLGGLAAMANAARKLVTDARPELRFIGLVGTSWSLEYLIESSAAPGVLGTPHLCVALWGARAGGGTGSVRADAGGSRCVTPRTGERGRR